MKKMILFSLLVAGAMVAATPAWAQNTALSSTDNTNAEGALSQGNNISAVSNEVQDTYHYTTYTEWKVKCGYEGEWTWSDLIWSDVFSAWLNNFREESIYWDPSSGGINIGSCAECPIKKDWFPIAEIEGASNFGEDDEIVVALSVIDDETVTVRFIDPGVALAVENVDAAPKAQGDKFIKDGQLYLRRGESIYNATGARVE